MTRALLYFWLLVANVYDFITTKILLDKGLYIEGNPVMRWLMTITHSVYSILWIKLFYIAVLFFGLQYFEAKHPQQSKKWHINQILLTVNILLTIVVVRSFYFMHIL